MQACLYCSTWQGPLNRRHKENDLDTHRQLPKLEEDNRGMSPHIVVEDRDPCRGQSSPLYRAAPTALLHIRLHQWKQL